MDLKKFLEEVAPYNQREIEGFKNKIITAGNLRKGVLNLKSPIISIYCGSPKCNGFRRFSKKMNTIILKQQCGTIQLNYYCQNCKDNLKRYSILYRRAEEKKAIFFEKYGEYPRFGTRVPNSLLDIFGSGDDREKFLKGRKSEDQGFGVGAFSYYRRVVENQKNRLIDKIIEVAKLEGIKDAELNKIKEAKNEKKFSQSVKKISDIIPDTLYLKTHNPLTLLHNELSKGIHDKSDKECLNQAKHIRVILSKLVKKMEFILEEDKELRNSLNEIFNEDE